MLRASRDFIAKRNELKANIFTLPIDDFKSLIIRLILEYGINESEAVHFISSDSNYIYVNGCPYADCIDIIESSWYNELREYLLDCDDFDDMLISNRRKDLEVGNNIHHTFSTTLTEMILTNEIEQNVLCDFLLANRTKNFVESAFFNPKLHCVKRLQKTIFYTKCSINLIMRRNGCDNNLSLLIMSFM